MGPLVPDLVSTNLNYIVALIIGILFGAILEQAGFSTSKKLVGLFYGYDFTVLRVFFTAGIVAMIGVMGLSHFGLLDISLIYINPTFLWSALIGGLIMGLGFVVGGFCPGTSFCAAAIGKIDAMIFIVGGLLGVLVFAEGYPLFEGLYKASNLGNPRLFETLGVSQNIFAFIMVVFALSAFWFTSMIENKVNKISKPSIRFTPYYVGLASIGALMMISAFIFPDRRTSIKEDSNNPQLTESLLVTAMTADELAYRLMDNYDKQLQIIDFRTEAEFKKFSLPKSTLMTMNNLFEKEPTNFLSIKHRINLIVANDEATERKIAFAAHELGFKRIQILKGGLDDFRNQILNYNANAVANKSLSHDTNRFRLKASALLPAIIENSKSLGPVKKTQKRVLGGC